MSRLGVPDERPEVDGPRGEEEGEDVGGGERAEDDECVGEVERRDHDHQPERVEREEGPEVEARRPVPPPEQVHALHRLAAHLEPRHARRPQIGAGELRGGRRRGGEGELRSGFDANLRGGGGLHLQLQVLGFGWGFTGSARVGGVGSAAFAGRRPRRDGSSPFFFFRRGCFAARPSSSSSAAVIYVSLRCGT